MITFNKPFPNFFTFFFCRKSEFQYVYQLHLGLLPPRTIRLRLNVTGFNPNVQKPIRVSAQFNKGTQSWNVPYNEGQVTFNFVERTLCLLEDNDVRSGADQEGQVINLVSWL